MAWFMLVEELAEAVERDGVNPAEVPVWLLPSPVDAPEGFVLFEADVEQLIEEGTVAAPEAALLASQVRRAQPMGFSPSM